MAHIQNYTYGYYDPKDLYVRVDGSEPVDYSHDKAIEYYFNGDISIKFKNTAKSLKTFFVGNTYHISIAVPETLGCKHLLDVDSSFVLRGFESSLCQEITDTKLYFERIK